MSTQSCWNCGGETDNSALGHWCFQCDVTSLDFTEFELDWFQARRQRGGMEWQEKTVAGDVVSVWVDFIDHAAEYAPTP